MLKVIELIIENNDDGIQAISVVDRPAIEENFIALKESDKFEFKEIDSEKRILMGAALVPDKKIYRANEKGEEYFVFFSKDTVRKASEMFFQKSNQNNATHQHEKKIDKMSVVESWIIEDEVHDKSAKYNMSLPVGSWVISMKCDNDEVWNDVKKGKVKGFSIEGYFADKLEMQIEEEKKYNEIIKILSNG